jgi:hypothetical protein
LIYQDENLYGVDLTALAHFLEIEVLYVCRNYRSRLLGRWVGGLEEGLKEEVEQVGLKEEVEQED